MHYDPKRIIFNGKPLLYMQEAVPTWIMSTGEAICYMLPSFPLDQLHIQKQLIENLDGLVLHGGVDISPESYGQTPKNPLWCGDRKRDLYELALLDQAKFLDRPVLGICRGMQLINVYFGGSLYQDIITECPKAHEHRNQDLYEHLEHPIHIKANSKLSEIYSGALAGRINSIHHQGVDKLGDSLEAEAYSDDGFIESIILKNSKNYFRGVQWHPEFHQKEDKHLLNSKPLLQNFLEICKYKKEQRNNTNYGNKLWFRRKE
jgi:putative glutamine amidotransferase